MKKIITFLTELRENNNRDWFEANKTRYKELQGQFNAVVEKLIEGVEGFDPLVRGLTVKDCTYRIYRDTRFSKDKTPYKTHMGAYICPKGKKSGYAGYYFHLEPKGEGLLGGHLLSSGIYMPEPVILKSIRDEIYDNGDALLKAVKKAKGFKLNESNKLKKVPSGFPADSPYAEFLKLKDFYVYKDLTDDYIYSNDLVKKITDDFRSTYALSSILNRAVDFAYEEMM